jgi:hypothetical protein
VQVEVEEEDPDAEADELARDTEEQAAQDAVREERMLLARQAFGLMDTSGDGELSRSEVIRAFRLDDELRDMMLPLLSVPAEKFSVTGVNVKAQVEAFEDAFRRMDADGTNSVSLHEFETFFSAGAKAGRQRKKAAARKKLGPSPVGVGSPPAAMGAKRGSRRRLHASESAPELGRNKRAGARLPAPSPIATGIGRSISQQIPWRKECPKSVAERALRLPPLSSSPSGAGGYDHWAPPVVRLELAKLQSPSQGLLPAGDIASPAGDIASPAGDAPSPAPPPAADPASPERPTPTSPPKAIAKGTPLAPIDSASPKHTAASPGAAVEGGEGEGEEGMPAWAIA